MPEILRCRDCHEDHDKDEGHATRTFMRGNPPVQQYIFSCKDCWNVRAIFAGTKVGSQEELTIMQECLKKIFNLRKKITKARRKQSTDGS